MTYYGNQTPHPPTYRVSLRLLRTKVTAQLGEELGRQHRAKGLSGSMPSLSPPPLASPIPRKAAPYPPAHTPAPAYSPQPRIEADADAKLRVRDGKGVATMQRAKWAGGRPLLGMKRSELMLLGSVVLLAVVVRMYKLHQPSSVVFDEVHFGGFASKYIRGNFFMDVHPPLAKLLITLAAFIGGFDGMFDFKDIGKDYLADKVPYVTMRMLPATLGVALVPISYLTLRALRLSTVTSVLGSLLITFDNGLTTQSRLILLDSPLLFFTALSTLFWVRFSNLDSSGAAFTRAWWTNLTLTGLALGAVLSCKWVGLFTIALVGLCTVRQLWVLLGNLKVTPKQWARHFYARALCLIVVPAIFYMFMFQIHFWILNWSGDGDGFMSSEFQHTLGGHGMEDTFADVAFGSKVSIRHVNTQGGYLHSHAHAYPGGSKQQQITLYPHRDENNLWRITNASSETGEPDINWDPLPIEHVLAGAKIRLVHTVTEKRLHSHDVRPPVSEVDFQNEVSGYGFPGFAGDANDDFIVEIDPSSRRRDRQAKYRLRTLRTHFRLRHVMTGCYLFSHKVKLPEWGFEQQEVTCNKNPTWANSLWYVETNSHPQLPPDAEKVNYRRPGFLAKFLELQAVMWRTNAGLTERHAYDSRPSSWPWLRRGINFWVKDHRQIYLVGNPVIWWGSSLAVAIYIAVRGLLVLRAKRGYRDLYQPKTAFYDEICGFLVLGWALHYLPFFLMARQLFLHHYLPALYFAILTLSAVFDYLTSRVKPRTRLTAAFVILLLAVYVFRHFSPLSYGNPWTKQECMDSKWLKTWDFSCNDFHNDMSSYKTVIDAAPVQSPKIEISDGISEADAITTTLVGEVPEPGNDVFQAVPEVEEKTIAPVGPVNEVPHVKSSDLPPKPAEGTPVEVAEDLRVPVGKDAGDPEATSGGDVVEGGWQGGAEDAPIKFAKAEQPVAQEPVAAGRAPRIELDETAKMLVEQALANDD